MRRLAGRWLAIMMLVVLVLTALPPRVSATSTTGGNTAVQDARNGVLQVMVAAQNSKEEWINVYSGSAFLIGTDGNAQHVVTCDHVANAMDYATNDELVSIAEYLGVKNQNKIKWKVRVVIKRDTYYDCEIVNNSEASDFAILKMEAPIYNRTPLTLKVSDPPVSEVEDVYALGFPQIVQNIQVDSVYDASDVTTVSGTVSKVADVQLRTSSPIPCITHNAVITSGNSGGPLVNANGEVVGIDTFTNNEDGDSSYYYAVQITEAASVLDAMGIEYIKVGEGNKDETAPETESETAAETATEPESDAVDKTELQSVLEDAQTYSEESYSADTYEELQDAIKSGASVYDNADASADEVQSAVAAIESAEAGLEEAAGGSNTMLIIIIAAAVIVLIIIIVLVVVLSSGKKKKKKPEPTPHRTPATPPAQPAASAGGFQPNRPVAPAVPRTSPADEGSNPTGVLNDGSNATTVLSNQNMPKAYLVRRKNGERISVNRSTFKIGKERRKVDYCIADNTNVSRTHADILYKDGNFWIVDQHSTNGTTVNSASIAPGELRKLTGNEVIRVADEEFTFKLF